MKKKERLEIIFAPPLKKITNANSVVAVCVLSWSDFPSLDLVHPGLIFF